MNVEVRGTSLPGRRFGGCENVHVGVQRKAEVVELVPGDAESAGWTFEITTKPGLRGPNAVNGLDFAGPFVHGKKGDRFLYLSWGTVAPDGRFAMFRRAKLMLAAVDPAILSIAQQPGARLVCTLALTGADGGPVCAARRPPQVAWTAEVP